MLEQQPCLRELRLELAFPLGDLGPVERPGRYWRISDIGLSCVSVAGRRAEWREILGLSA
jgi:hypothetical protein